MKKLLASVCIPLLLIQSSQGQEAPSGQWEGSASFDIGSNFVRDMSTRTFSRSSGNVSAWGKYSTDKFFIKLDLKGLNEFAASTLRGRTLNVKDPASPELNIDIIQKEKSVLEEKTGVQMEYRPDSRNTFSFSAGQKFDRQSPEQAGISITQSFSGDNYETLRASCSFNIEEVLQKSSLYNAKFGWIHRFEKPGREMESSAGWELTRIDKSSTWFISPVSDIDLEEETQSGEEPDRIYRITPVSVGNDFSASVLYRDNNLFGQKSLNLELGLIFKAGFDRDRLSAANYKNEMWVDSLEYRESFRFVSLEAVPKAKMSYSPDKFSVSLQLTPDFYATKLDSEPNLGEFKSSKVVILPDLSALWAISPKHNVGISYKQSLTHPTYLQLCWFPRTGDYENEQLMGNPDLKPSLKGNASLSYTFRSGFFTAKLEGTSTINWDKIEKVFNNKDGFRVYTWINSGRSLDNSVKLSMSAAVKNFKASLGGYYNHFAGYNNAGNVTRSSDWGMNADALLKVRGGWTFSVKGRYQSKIIRSYSSITQYIGCDARVDKDFRRFSIFIQGKDLFDQTIEVITYSEDHTYARIEENFYNRRIFSAGISVKF